MLKEEFAAIYEAPDRAEAERRLEVWIDHIIETDLPEFTNIWRTLQWWVEPILAYFEDRVTNFFAEGITNKIKVMKRMSYGFATRPGTNKGFCLMSFRRRRADPPSFVKSPRTARKPGRGCCRKSPDCE